MPKVPKLPRLARRRILKKALKTGEAGVVRRTQIVVNAAAGRSALETADVVGCAKSTVYDVLNAFDVQGWLALLDGRRGNGSLKANDDFRRVVRCLLDQSPRDYSYLRPTWTRELLVAVAREQTGVEVSVCVMGRVLRAIGARRGRPKPVVEGSLSERQQRRRLKAIRDLIAELHRDDVAVYEDEIDIHLNPKIGADWMNCGAQKFVMTPGQNQKAYLAGTLDARDGTLVWVGGTKKNSGLFIAMLQKLEQHYSAANRIHVILDNYGIHKSREVASALEGLPRIRLHFLPPYCPDENKIERVWLDLHANVTRNHKHSELRPLCADVATYLNYISPWTRATNDARPPLRVRA
jgi:transposase